jgi:hypothetical protein
VAGWLAGQPRFTNEWLKRIIMGGLKNSFKEEYG